MANREQLKILKQGAYVWNKWREEHESNEIDLTKADLRGIDLSKAFLDIADLRKADMSQAKLWDVSLVEADLRETNLRKSSMNGAVLYRANLIGSDLREADLIGTRFLGNSLRKANFDEANMGGTVFSAVDLSDANGLENAIHYFSSSIDVEAIRFSKGKIPQEFLSGCGLSNWEIESAKLFNPGLTNEEINKILYKIYDLRATQALQISPLFISYSHADTSFVDRIDRALTKKGIRFWRDIHDAKAGRLETQIDRAIRQNPTVLLVLSENSLGSDWVEHEVRHARKLEKELGRDTLCPIALDDTWKSSPWPERVMEQIKEYNILDFSGWQDKSTFDNQFAKLLSGLEIFYKKPET